MVKANNFLLCSISFSVPYLSGMAAVTREMKLSISHAARTEVAPNLTITTFFDGMITTYCSWYPLAKKASVGTLGHSRSFGFTSVLAFSQNRAPYCPFGVRQFGSP